MTSRRTSAPPAVLRRGTGRGAVRLPVLLAALLAAVLLAAPGAPAGAVAPTTAGPSPSPAPSGYPASREVLTRTVDVAGTTRTLTVARPAGRPRAVVVLLHAHWHSRERVVQRYGVSGLLDRGVLVLVPAGVRASWHAAPGCCGGAADARADDVAMLLALSRLVPEYAPREAPRVLAGFSTGAMLASRAVCNGGAARAGFAGVLMSGGTVLGACNGPSLPRVLVQLHGGQDASVRFARSTPRAEWRTVLPAADAGLARLRAGAGCSAPTTRSAGDTRTRTARCPHGEVRQLLRRSVGHDRDALGAPAVLRGLLHELTGGAVVR